MRTSPLIVILAVGCGSGTVDEVVPEGCPTLQTSQGALSFTDARLDGPTTAVLTLSHACNAGPSLSVQVLAPDGNGFAVDTTELALDPGQQAELTVSYTASSYAPQSSELFLLSEDPVQPTIRVALEASTDPDQDADGVEATAAGGQDCDDADPSVGPEQVETWNGVDDDCDGRVDAMPVTAVEHGYLVGGAYRALAYQGNLGLGDFEGDGSQSLVVASTNGYGYGYVLDASEFRRLDDEAGRYADASWAGAYAYNALGNIGPRFADHTADGIADLVVTGLDYSYADRGNRAVAVFDGTALGLELSIDNAVLTLAGSVRYGGDSTSHGDMDGDGLPEIVYGSYQTIPGTPDNGRGAVILTEVDGATGERSLVDDADAMLVGESDYDYLGRMPTTADLDGDGYDDLVVGASGEDSGASGAGMIYVIGGSSGALADGDAGRVARARIQGEVQSGYLGYGPDPLVADVDGDEVVDLVLGSVYEDAVYVFSDASTVEGELDADDADYILDGSGGPDYYGFGLASGDFDGDGDPELAVGAPDTYAYRQSAVGDRGEVTLYDLTGGVAEPIGWFQGEGRQDTFGQTLMATDLDGDGTDELLADAPGYDGGGRLYLLTWSGEQP